MQPWEIDARESIRDLTTRYNSNGDSGRFDAVRALFHDDAEMHIDGTPYIGIDAIMTIFTGTRDRLGDGTAETPRLVRHFTGTHQIDIDDENTARGRLYFFVVTGIGPDHWGTYMDRYRRGDDGTWRFARRNVKLEGRSPNSLFGA